LTLKRRLRIAVDFDGTCVEERYPGIGKEMPGCIKSLMDLQLQGHTLILWTCRGGEPLKNAVNWLADRGIHFDWVNVNCKAEIDEWGNDPRKVAADIYIDDRVLGGFPGWSNVMEAINRKCSS